MNEKEKLLMRLKRLEVALQLARKRQVILEIDMEDEINRLLDEYSKVKKDFEKLNE